MYIDPSVRIVTKISEGRTSTSILHLSVCVINTWPQARALWQGRGCGCAPTHAHWWKAGQPSQVLASHSQRSDPGTRCDLQFKITNNHWLFYIPFAVLLHRIWNPDTGFLQFRSWVVNTFGQITSIELSQAEETFLYQQLTIFLQFSIVLRNLRRQSYIGVTRKFYTCALLNVLSWARTVFLYAESLCCRSRTMDSGLPLGVGYKWATGIENLKSKLGNSFVELPCTRRSLSCKGMRMYAQTTCNPENQGFCFQLCTVADSVGFLPLPWSKTYGTKKSEKRAIERDCPGSSCYSSRFSKSREDRILRGRQLSSILVQQNIYHHMIRQARTGDTVLVKSREMTGRTHTAKSQYRKFETNIPWNETVRSHTSPNSYIHKRFVSGYLAIVLQENMWTDRGNI